MIIMVPYLLNTRPNFHKYFMHRDIMQVNYMLLHRTACQASSSSCLYLLSWCVVGVPDAGRKKIVTLWFVELNVLVENLNTTHIQGNLKPVFWRTEFYDHIPSIQFLNDNNCTVDHWTEGSGRILEYYAHTWEPQTSFTARLLLRQFP